MKNTWYFCKNRNQGLKKQQLAYTCNDMFKDIPLKLPRINFEDPITDQILKLERLRYKMLDGTTHPMVFNQLKQLFHTFESIGSSRIEGNNTTISDYIETTKITQPTSSPENIQEISNIEEAMHYIEENVSSRPIDRIFLSELHQLVVSGLNKEGDHTPGQYRKTNVKISGSFHTPPDYTLVNDMMDELFNFCNANASAKYDLLRIAVAHHRFVWIHPFGNGNGRVVRLFTYALLLKKIFNNPHQRIINPTAVFCSNRKNYYYYLSLADQGTDEGMIRWCMYMLRGLRMEIEKIDKLMDYTYLKGEILLPALVHAQNHKFITDDEYSILKITISLPNQELRANNLKILFPDKSSVEITRMIKKLINKKMLISTKDNGRRYIISFINNFLLRSIYILLYQKKFLSLPDSEQSK